MLGIISAIAMPLCSVFPATAADLDILPDVSLCMEAVRYVPPKTDQGFAGTISGRSGLVGTRTTAFYLSASVETILGSERRPFDANQGSYHIELGLDQRLQDVRLTPFFHHVSRHELDRSKPEAVDWNVLGLRVDGPWPRHTQPRLRVSFSAGHTTAASLIGYRWEFTGKLDAVPTPRTSAEIHGRARARLVTTAPSERFSRKRFLDYSAELAVRWTRRRRTFEAFVSLDHRNDVLLTAPDIRTRLLLGVRFGLDDERGRELPAATATESLAPSTRQR
jgi:hypothetical protein